MKYNEREALKEIEEYIESTYGQHYVGKDKFQIQIDFYRDRYEEEFQAIMRDGVEYDEDGGGTVSDSEKEPLHQLRLVR